MSVESKIRDFLKKGKEIEESLQLAEEVNELEEKAAAENLKPMQPLATVLCLPKVVLILIQKCKTSQVRAISTAV